MGRQQQRDRQGAPKRRRVNAGRVRVIAGEWRGRPVPVQDSDGLRPTGDRLRETLFNWLAPYIAGARCLDLFAGSGALGIEALSRGAAHCDFVEVRAPLAQALSGTLDVFGARPRSRVHARDALAFLGEDGAGPWDIVFIDPPFDLDLAEPVLASLAGTALLGHGALVYLEQAHGRDPVIPDGLAIRRQTRSGAVAAWLLDAAITEPAAGA